MSADTVNCPHCGESQGDLWDHDWGTREEVRTECGECGKAVTLTRTVDYAMRKDEAVCSSCRGIGACVICKADR
jgi:endogenous inhibitor of DNA gyrase (YacG/DUF329 family)